jgi:hypothetical protein
VAIDLSDIKTQTKSILDTANTTTADYYLSVGMTNKVARIMKVNPLKIPTQPSFFPYLTIYTDNKGIKLSTIAKNQLAGRREAEISFNLVGAIWESTIKNVDEDDADEEIEKLMENAEEIIRRNFKLNNTVTWTNPVRTSYDAIALGEETIMRAGLFEFVAKIQNY